MSVNRNIESVAEQGEFHARVPRDEPLTTKGVSLHSHPKHLHQRAFTSRNTRLT